MLSRKSINTLSRASRGGRASVQAGVELSSDRTVPFDSLIVTGTQKPREAQSCSKFSDTKKADSTAKAKRKGLGLIYSRRAISAATFNIGTDYELPIADHNHKIKHGYKIGEFGTKPKKTGYMSAVIKRARS